MSEQSTQTVPGETRVPVHPVLWIMTSVMVGFEVMFAVADAGLLPDWLGRTYAYYRFAFIDGDAELEIRLEGIRGREIPAFNEFLAELDVPVIYLP